MTTYSISLAETRHLHELPAIELAAATRFRALNVPQSVFSDATAAGTFAAAQAEGLLWVALAGDSPVGFAMASVSGSRLYVDEIDVAPEHAGRGLGRALLAEVEGRARALGCTEIALTTYRDVPWNAPFYRRLGFKIADDPDPGLIARLDEEASRGMDTMPRVGLLKVLGRATGEASD